MLEVYTTPLDADGSNADESLDVYILFKSVLLSIQQNDPAWYLALTNHLNGDQMKSINEIMVLADQRRVEVENKKREKLAGIYSEHKELYLREFSTHLSFSNYLMNNMAKLTIYFLN